MFSCLFFIIHDPPSQQNSPDSDYNPTTLCPADILRPIAAAELFSVVSGSARKADVCIRPEMWLDVQFLSEMDETKARTAEG